MDVKMEGLTDLRKDRWMDGCGDGGIDGFKEG